MTIHSFISVDSTILYQGCRSKEPATQSTAYRTLWEYLLPIAYQLVHDQPDADALAQESTQRALIRIHQRIIECHDPATFLGWARRIVSNLAIDELRYQKRMTALPDADDNDSNNPAHQLPDVTVLARLGEDELRALIVRAPISDRSRRVVIGRYLDDLPDEVLAQIESKLHHSVILPHHVQVTRAKNFIKLRNWQPLRALLTQE